MHIFTASVITYVRGGHYLCVVTHRDEVFAVVGHEVNIFKYKMSNRSLVKLRDLYASNQLAAIAVVHKHIMCSFDDVDCIDKYIWARKEHSNNVFGYKKNTSRYQKYDVSQDYEHHTLQNHISDDSGFYNHDASQHHISISWGYCDVNAAARLIDLTACMYVPAPAGLLEQQ